MSYEAKTHYSLTLFTPELQLHKNVNQLILIYPTVFFFKTSCFICCLPGSGVIGKQGANTCSMLALEPWGLTQSNSYSSSKSLISCHQGQFWSEPTIIATYQNFFSLAAL